MYAPIVLFAFNRLEPLKRCVASLIENIEAAKSDLIVYVDGPRFNREGETEMVKSVREYVKSINGFKTIETHFSEDNKGLGVSVIAGVTDVINKYGKAIVVEDDLIVSRNFLAYMNRGIDQYEHNNEVWSICGFGLKVKTSKNYNYDAYFCPRSSSWGWATWKDRWNACDWELREWSMVECNAKAFNHWGGSDCFGMLRGWKEGRNQSWAIRFCYNQFVHNGLSLFPTVSKIYNAGFDGNGTNCKHFNRYKFIFDTTTGITFKFPNDIVVKRKMSRQFLGYYSIPIRIYSRLMNMYYSFRLKFVDKNE